MTSHSNYNCHQNAECRISLYLGLQDHHKETLTKEPLADLLQTHLKMGILDLVVRLRQEASTKHRACLEVEASVGYLKDFVNYPNIVCNPLFLLLNTIINI